MPSSFQECRQANRQTGFLFTKFTCSKLHLQPESASRVGKHSTKPACAHSTAAHTLCAMSDAGSQFPHLSVEGLIFPFPIHAQFAKLPPTRSTFPLVAPHCAYSVLWMVYIPPHIAQRKCLICSYRPSN